MVIQSKRALEPTIPPPAEGNSCARHAFPAFSARSEVGSIESLADSLKILEREVAVLRNEVARLQGIRMRRRPATGPPLHYEGPPSPSRGVLREDFDPGNTINNCAIPSTYMLASTAMEAMEDTGTNVLNAEDDRYGGVTVYLDECMDPTVLASLLQSSMSNWRDQGKNSVWIKLTKAHINLLDAVWKAGFRYHHDQPDYWMLVHQIPNPADTLAANASHHVGTGAFVINDKREVLVVQERDGWFKGTGVYKLPTGTVGVGEDISAAAIRQVKEQTGIEAEFVQVLTLRQSHKSFPQKSDLFIVCMLLPLSSDIQMQDPECAAAQWMPVEEYAAQPFVQLTSSLDSVAKICLKKLGGNYNGFTPLPSLACNCKGYDCETFMDRLGCSS